MRSSQRSRRSTCWQRPGRTRASFSATRPWQTSCRVCWRRACANDLIHPHCRSKQGLLTPVTFAQMTAGYRALADMAHAQGVRIWFCELTPWKGYTRNLFGRGDDIHWSPELDALRPELNAWFQSADCPADGYIPLDALADPDDPDALIAAYTTDGVHHTPAGQRALAALIPEDIFRETPKEVHP